MRVALPSHQVVVGDMTHGGTFGRAHEGICRDQKSGVSQPVIVKTVSGENRTYGNILTNYVTIVMAKYLSVAHC